MTSNNFFNIEKLFNPEEQSLIMRLYNQDHPDLENSALNRLVSMKDDLVPTEQELYITTDNPFESQKNAKLLSAYYTTLGCGIMVLAHNTTEIKNILYGVGAITIVTGIASGIDGIKKSRIPDSEKQLSEKTRKFMYLSFLIGSKEYSK